MTTSSRAPLATVLVALTLTGCGAGATAPPSAAVQRPCPASTSLGGARSLVLVLPVHQGASTGARSPWRCAIREALDTGVPISVVTAEGLPKVAVRGFLSTPTRVNLQAHQDDLDAAEATLVLTVNSLRASSAGNDTWAAALLAADQGASTGSPVLVLFSDNGLSDTGLIRMTEPGMPLADSGDVVTFVKDNKACGRLAGSTWVLSGLGEAVLPQPALSARQRANIAEIYASSMKACDAAVTVRPAPASGSGPTTTLRTGRVTPETPATLSVRPATRISLPDSSALGYQPDSAEFRDLTAARATLAHIAEQLRSQPNVTVRITGRTSNGATAWVSHEALGKARADRCAGLLVQAGVRPSQITTVGAGYTAQPPVTNPTTAALNRSTDFTFSRPAGGCPEVRGTSVAARVRQATFTR